MTLPVRTELPQIAGVPTFKEAPAGAPTGDDSPVYLDIHGGALILGGGDLTRVMTEIGPMSAPIVRWAPDYRMPQLHPYSCGTG